eukprot:scaffold36621_cov18-Prasinocladus_malaysianus.AAC.2
MATSMIATQATQATSARIQAQNLQTVRSRNRTCSNDRLSHMGIAKATSLVRRSYEHVLYSTGAATEHRSLTS